MASGKKGKKTKGKTIALTDFLLDTPGQTAAKPFHKSVTNWADEVEENDGCEPIRHKVNVVLPTAPKASRDFDDIDTEVPKDPPFVAYISNLPYDVDEEEIANFLQGLNIASMKLPKEERPGEPPKLRGFGYVEFEDRQSFISALAIQDTTMKSRRIRIEIASNVENDRRRGRMDMGRDRQERSDVSFGDWRSGPRADNHDDRGGSRGGYNRDSGFNRDRTGGGGFTRDREGGGGFTRDREGGGGFTRDRDGGGGFTRDRDGGGFTRDRDEDKSSGSWRDSANDRITRNHDDDRGQRGGFGNRDRGRYDDNRDNRRGGGFRRFDDDRTEREDRDDHPTQEPRQRQKLNLIPRTKPVEAAEHVAPAAKETTTVPSASIFGNAKPVDTSQRERQIEEKLAKESLEKDKEDRRHIERPNRTIRRSDSPPTHQDPPPPPAEERPKAPEGGPRPPRDPKDPPKLKEQDPPNFAASNKFAFLETEDSDQEN